MDGFEGEGMKKDSVIRIISVVAAATAVFSAWKLAAWFIGGAREAREFDELTQLVDRDRAGQQPDAALQEAPAGGTEAPQERQVLPEYAEAHGMNGDLFGWLRIEGTKIDYPVMHTPEDGQYYLHRSFKKSRTDSGTPFLDERCREGCGNYLIYGHRMNNGSMFGVLPDYEDPAFREAHATIAFDTLYARGEYTVLAAFYCKLLPEGEPGFRYYEYTDLTDPAVFEEYLAQVREAAAYDTGVTAEYGDELITLSTCSRHDAEERFVVVAVKKAA